ncbi:MAG: tetratricopeptide repeat protein [Gemmatimonadaceae bacterium]
MISPRRQTAAFPIVVALITIVCFLPALNAGFVSWDDERNFLTNPHYRGLGLTQLRWMWTTTRLGHYVPLSWMTLGADYVAWGMDPRGYHLTNLLIHAANAVLLFFLARRVLAASAIAPASDRRIDFAAATTALLFATHPLRVESVAWVTERRDVLSGFFGLLSVLFYMKSVGGSARRGSAYAASVAFFICALFSKGTSVTIPAVLLILNFYPLRRVGGATGWGSASARRAYTEMIPFAIPAAGFVVLSIVALSPPEQLPLASKLAVSAYSLSFYLAKTLLPSGLAALYARPLDLNPFETRFLGAYVGAIAFVLVILMSWKKRPGLAAGLLAFAAISFPLLGVVQNGPQIAADRYTYHSSPALAMLGGAMFLLVARRVSLAGATSLAAVIVTVLGVLTWRQTTYWRSSETLWARVLRIEPNSPIANSAWANVLYDQNRVDEAIDHSMRAVRAAPRYAEAQNDLGVGLARQGAPEEAMERFRLSLSLKPGFDDAENNWGVVQAGRGQLDSAIVHYQRALASNPDNADAELNWGNVLVRRGRTDEAIEHYRKALWIRPDHADAHHNWGVALARDGRLADAVLHFQSALAIQPNHAEARSYLDRATRLLREQSPRGR